MHTMWMIARMEKQPFRIDGDATCTRVPYEDEEHAFFCMVQTQRAKAEGANFRQTGFQRVGTGIDVQNCIAKLMREGKLATRHAQVLSHYGRQMMPPDPQHPNQKRHYEIWCEALDILKTELAKRGMIAVPQACRLI